MGRPPALRWALLAAALRSAPTQGWLIVYTCGSGGCAEVPLDPVRVGFFQASVRSVIDSFETALHPDQLGPRGESIEIRRFQLRPLADPGLAPQQETIRQLRPDHIVSTSTGRDTWEAVSQLAWRLPDTLITLLDSFSLFACDTDGPPTNENFQGKGCANLQAVAYREDEAAFLAGGLAGLLTRTRRVAALAGIPIPALRRFRNGFNNGVRRTCPACVSDGIYANAFNDPERGAVVCGDLASRGKGADIIFGAAGGTGSGCIAEAARLGTWVIGVDVDEYHTTFEGGNRSKPRGALAGRLLSSALKKIDVGAKVSVEQAIRVGAGEQEFTRGWRILDSTLSAIGLADCHETCGQWEAARAHEDVDQLTAQLKVGALRTSVNPDSGANELAPWLQEGTASPGLLYSMGGHFGDPWPAQHVPVLGHHPSPTTAAFIVFGDFSQVRSYLIPDYTLDRQWVPGIAPVRERYGVAAQFSSALLFGGNSNGSLLGDLHRVGHCIPCGDHPTWEQVAVAGPHRPGARHRHAMAGDGASGAVLLFGQNVDGQLLDDVWYFNATDSTWNEITTPEKGPIGRLDAAATIVDIELTFGGRTDRRWLFLFGGIRSQLLNDLWALPASGEAVRDAITTRGAHWASVDVPARVIGRQLACLAITSVHIIVAGGLTATGPAGDMWVRHHDLGGVWTQVDPRRSAPPERPGMPDSGCAAVGAAAAADFPGGYVSCVAVDALQEGTLVTDPYTMPTGARHASLYMAFLGGSGRWRMRTFPLLNCSTADGLVPHGGGAGCVPCDLGHEPRCTQSDNGRQRCACVPVPAVSGAAFPLWGIPILAGGVLLLSLPVVWKLTANQRRIARLYNSNRIAEECAVAIAAMSLDEEEAKLSGIENPNTIQRAFIRIITSLKLYREYLPMSILHPVDLGDVREVESEASVLSGTHSGGSSQQFEQAQNPVAPRRRLSIGSAASGSRGSQRGSDVSRLTSSWFKGRAWGARNISQRDMQRGGDALEQQHVRLALGLRVRNVSVVAFNVRGFLAYADHSGPGATTEVHSKLLGAVLRFSKQCGGSADPFSGDHISVHFNTVAPAVTHCKLAATAARGVVTALADGSVDPPSQTFPEHSSTGKELSVSHSPRSGRLVVSPTPTSPQAGVHVVQVSPSRMSTQELRCEVDTLNAALGAESEDLLADRVVVGLASGKALVGNMGTCGMKAYAVIGGCFPHAVLLTLLTKHYSVCALADEKIRQETRPHFLFAAAGRYLYQKAGHKRPVTLYELVGSAAVGDNEEWMYQLEQLERADPFRTLNSAVEAWCRGGAEAAESILAEGQQPTQRAQWLIALLGDERTRGAGPGHVDRPLLLDVI